MAKVFLTDDFKIVGNEDGEVAVVCRWCDTYSEYFYATTLTMVIAKAKEHSCDG